MKMNAKNLWNKGTEEQRSKLLKSIYKNNHFDYMTEKDADDVPFGIMDRIQKLINISPIANKRIAV